MSEQNLFKNYTQLIIAIEHCIEEHLVMPALVLIYTAIDSVSWLSVDDPNIGVGERFMNWVANWMHKAKPLPCTPEELYAARCGVLHTLTPDSNLSEKKGVRCVVYAWGKAEVDQLHESIIKLQHEDIVGVHINDLFDSFRLGFADFIDSTMNDEEASRIFSQRAKKHFVNIDRATMSSFLEFARNNGA